MKQKQLVAVESRNHPPLYTAFFHAREERMKVETFASGERRPFVRCRFAAVKRVVESQLINLAHSRVG